MAGDILDIKIPNLAESVTEGDLGSWLVENGAQVKKDQPILELETDKATVEIAAEASGVLEIVVQAGETVRVGDIVGRITEGSGAQAVKSEAPPEAERADETQRPADDVAPKKPLPQPARADAGGAPSPEAARAEPDSRRVKMTRLRRRIAERMVEAQQTAAILTTFNEIDMAGIFDLRRENQERFEAQHGVRLGFMSLFARASILSLRDFPEINASIDGDEIVYHDRVHLGIAVGTPRGLVVPVLREADRLSFAEIERRIKVLAAKARDGDLAIEDLQGGTFTISNGGIYGSLMSTPILNPPQSGILGMHKIEKRAVVLADEATGEERIVSRPMMYVALSYDHRLVDGEQAVTFLVRVKERLEDPTRMLLDS